MAAGGAGCGPHSAAAPPPVSLPLPPQEVRAGGDGGEGPGGSHYLSRRPRHNILSAASTVRPEGAARRSFYQENLASQGPGPTQGEDVGNIRSSNEIWTNLCNTQWKISVFSKI